MTRASWYAFTVKPHHEKTISTALSCKGFEQFLPTYISERIVRNRKTRSTLPLLPGYVFCRLDSSDRLAVLQIPGVFSIVSFGREPAAINDEEMSALIAISRSGLKLMPWPTFQKGDSVHIEHGPLKGVAGEILSFRGAAHFVVLISLLKRSVSVEVESSWLRASVKPQGWGSRSAGVSPTGLGISLD